MWGDVHQLLREIIRVIIFSVINKSTNKLEIRSSNFISNSKHYLFEFLSFYLKKVFFYPEQVKTPARKFLKIGA
tara:strand:- start:192 stop:413 length:222 start_codon:yes stop_codon:yes gene_type:complete